MHPAFKSGQDGFLASIETQGKSEPTRSSSINLNTNFPGIMDETYYQALAFCQSTTRKGGIDAALDHDGRKLDGLLVPSSVGQSYASSLSIMWPIFQLLPFYLKVTQAGKH